MQNDCGLLNTNLALKTKSDDRFCGSKKLKKGDKEKETKEVTYEAGGLSGLRQSLAKNFPEFLPIFMAFFPKT